MTHTLFIDGEAGTTGLEIRERVEGRSDLELILLGDRRRDPEARREALNSADAVILCLPDDAASEAVAMIENPAVRVIDASTAHRVAPGWTYGFPEMDSGQPNRIANSTRVSNPGCYPTGFVALVRPLIHMNVLPHDWPITCNAVSGYSGGGKSMIEEFEGAEGDLAPPFRLYGLTQKHKHVAEMREYSGATHKPLFAPSVGRFRQGMLVEVPLQLLPFGHASSPPSIELIHGCLWDWYDGSRFVEVADLEATEAMSGLTPEGLNGTNRLRLHVFGDRDGHQARLVALLDNLGKGASGAAVQNLNLMLGLDEGTGLT